jgi:hypothetical protein
MPPRLNKYFLPGDGIRREVITADICRYLGNDALVKPGQFEVGFTVCPLLACLGRIPANAQFSGTGRFLGDCLSRFNFGWTLLFPFALWLGFVQSTSRLIGEYAVLTLPPCVAGYDCRPQG